MKTVKEIMNQDPVFLNEWTNKIEVIADFEGVYISLDEYLADDVSSSFLINQKHEMDNALERYKNINILFASYGSDNYSGDAWVLYEKDGRLYEANGNHCSCYGLEGQWLPDDEVVLEELENRLTNGTFGHDTWAGNEFNAEAKKFLGIE